MSKNRLSNVLFLAVSVMLVFSLAPVAAAPTPATSAPTGAPAVQVVPAGDGDLIVELSLPEYQIEEVVHDNAVYHRIHVAGDQWTQAGDAGAPQLPERGLLLAAPPTGAVALQVLEAAVEALPGRFTLQPAPQVIALPEASPDQSPLQMTWQADQAAYEQDAWLPAAQAEITQEGWWRGQRFVRLALRPFQVNPASGELQAAARMAVRVSFAASAQGAADNPLPADPIFDTILQAALPNFQQAEGWRARPQPSPLPAAAAKRLNSDATWVKITVDADGVYKVSYDHLAGAGVPTGELDSLNPRTLRLLDEGQEQAIHVVGQGDFSFDPADYILFYGRRNTAYRSDDNNVYWLTWGGADGVRMATQNGAPGAAPLADALLTSVYQEENHLYGYDHPFAPLLEPVDHDHWYWAHVEEEEDFTINLPNLRVDEDSAASPALSVFMTGGKKQEASYEVAAQLNGEPAAELMNWYGRDLVQMDLALPAGVLTDGDNALTLTPQTVAFNSDPSIWLDWVSLEYPYSGVFLSDATLYNANAGSWRYQVSQTPVNAPWILNVGAPAQPKRVINATAIDDGGVYTVTWQLTTGPDDRFLVVPAAEVRQPAAVALFTDSGLLDVNQQVDYLMISHGDFITTVQPLADMHAISNGLSVRIVDVQEVYDDFNDGSLSAEAIRDYLGYAYSNYQWPPPTFVLLVGDGTVDFRGYQYDVPPWSLTNKIPPYVGAFDAWSGASISDNAFVFLEGDDVLSEMIIGRLPVNDVAEALLVVGKTLDYAAMDPAQDWMQHTLWVADNPDAGGNFHSASDSIIARLLPDFAVNKVYFDPFNPEPTPPIYNSVPVARQAIIDHFTDGQLFINYSGHGGPGAWAHEWLFANTYVSQVTNGDRLAISVVSACATSYFARFEGQGLEENLIRYPDGGIVAGFAPTTFDILSSQTVLVDHFYDAIMRERLTQLGVAAELAKARAYADLTGQFAQITASGHMITGDPALRLPQPDDDCAAGDLDCDGDIDIVDVQIVAGAWNSYAWGDPLYNPRADLNNNRQIDINDVITVANLWGTILSP